ncbi:MAG: MATE family efflux transporter [Lachnospiraceae bacterium]|nr:MATE family efflux transporter [Lachnospiraceae bacterium]
MKRDRKSKPNMLTGAPGKTLFFFAMPMILGNLFQQFYNMADSVIVGRFVGEDALAAVGASYALTTVFVMLAIGGGTGSSVVTSQYLGAGKYREMRTSVFTALISFLGVSIVLAALGLGFSETILRALKTPDNILDAAGIYLKIYFAGLPFLFMYNVLAAMFNAMGDSRTPLYLLIFSSILNVVLDIVFVTQFSMGVAGVAIATVMAQGISAVISFTLLLQKLKTYGDGECQTNVYFDLQMLQKMIRVAIPTMLQQSIVSVGMLLVQSVVNGFGSSVLAGYTAGTRIESICIVPMIAMGNAVSTFTAQNMGGEKTDRVKRGYHAAYGIIACFAVLICVVLLTFKNQIIGVFMDENANQIAFETGVSYLSFIAFFFIFIGMKAITDGVLRGSGDVVVFTAANLINLTIRVVFANLCAPVFGVAAVWYAVPLGWTANWGISFVRYLSGKWKEKKLIQ